MMNTTACSAPVAEAPASRPTRIVVRRTGDASSRSKNPVWMSSAVSLPAVSPPKSTDCVIEAARRNASSDGTPSKPGTKSMALPIVELFTAAMNIGNSRPGSHTVG